MLYETHITVNVQDAQVAASVAADRHWKTSQIDGDPVLGDKPFFYLTRYGTNFEQVIEDLHKCVEDLKKWDVRVLREKIEAIIYDTKASEEQRLKQHPAKGLTEKEARNLYLAFFQNGANVPDETIAKFAQLSARLEAELLKKNGIPLPEGWV